MLKIILYIAASLDGFIARLDGRVDWLFTDGDYGYHDFYDSIETTLMGNTTYKQIKSFGVEFPYKEKENYVITRSADLPEEEYISYIYENVVEFVSELKQKEGKDIWLIGGAEIISKFLENGLIDEIILSVHPLLLGDGIPLFPQRSELIQLKLLSLKHYESGLVQLHYEIAAE